MAIISEQGAAGSIFSLNGIKGGQGRGRLLDAQTVVVPDITVTPVLFGNSNRCWAIISNRNAGNVLIYLGAQTAAYVTLAQYGVLQIDVNAPWSGEVYAYQSSGAPVNLDVMEAVIQQ
jgi:hypothetical protein